MPMEQLRGHIDLLVLAIIRFAPAHGYGMIQRARMLSEGFFNLEEGLVYPVLHKLERDKLIESDWSNASGRRRRIYRITAKGRAELSSKRAAWREVTQAMGLVLEST